MTTMCAGCIADGQERPAVTMWEGTALCTMHCRARTRRPQPAQPAPIVEQVERVQRLVSPPDRCGALPRIAIGDTRPRRACQLEPGHDVARVLHDDGHGHRWGPLWDDAETTP